MSLPGDVHQKVTARHLKRNAYLYVRQSTLRQVFENTESTERQYALRQRAVALGWPLDRIIVIDRDQGLSGATIEGRDGFQRLVGDVGMGLAGIVMGLEISRLARNSSDWHRLLEICALSDTLILDEDGIYDPAHFNDRLLLGLKGTMSEAELHVLRARLRGGILNKARRGELWSPLPIGLRYDSSERVILDPDKQVQETVHTFFRAFRRTGSAMATVKLFRSQGLRFPRLARSGPAKGELLWDKLEHSRALQVLHNPRYAGAFFFGRSRQKKQGGPGCFIRLPREEWIALLPNAHPGYISWDEFEENQRRLHENAQALGAERKKTPPREGPALLQGLVICGVCGDRMTVRYNYRCGALVPTYVCQREGIRHAEPICQSVPGRALDEAVARLLLDAVTPMALEATLTSRSSSHAWTRPTACGRATWNEPATRPISLAAASCVSIPITACLVADSLEAEWNQKLRAVTEAQEEYERQRQNDRMTLDDAQRTRILALATDLPKLWHEPTTPDRERKRMARLLIEDITLVKSKEITAHVRYRGGATHTLTLPLPLPAWALRKTSSEVIAELDRLLDEHTDAEIAHILTERGFRSGTSKPINALMVWRVRRHHKLKNRYQRLRERGMLTLSEAAKALGVSTATAKVWRRFGLLRAHAYNDKQQRLYEPPGPDAPIRYKPKGIQAAKRNRRSTSNPTGEVQCEA